MMRPALLLLIVALSAGAAGADPADQRALAETRRRSAAALAQAAGFERRAAQAAAEAGRARRAATAMVAHIRATEAEIAAARVRLDRIDRARRRQRDRLAIVRTPMVRLTAALQILARRPPALALMQPGSVADIVHVRALLTAGLPVIRARSAALRAELAAADRLRAAADATTAGLVAARARLEGQRRDLARLESTQRTIATRLVDSAMFAQDRATAFGEEARDLIDQIGRSGDQASIGAQLARLPAPIPRPILPGLPVGPIPDGAYIPYRLPVRGRVIAGLGEVSDAGVPARGISIAAAPDASVIAPADGRVAFAGQFRGYGRIVIVDHGDGWTTLVTGLAGIAVAAGDAVAAGTPIGTARHERAVVTIEVRHRGRPVDVAALVAAT